MPVACYLSGGIDSCAVLGFASRLSTRPIRAYTLSFDHADYDEADLARDQAERSGAEFCRIDVRSEHLADHFSDAIYHAERPFANAHAVAKYLLSRAVRDSGIKVVLTGEGSDEIFAGYPHFRRDLVLYGSNGHDPGRESAAARRARRGQSRLGRNAHAPGIDDARQRAARARLRPVEPRGLGADRHAACCGVTSDELPPRLLRTATRFASCSAASTSSGSWPGAIP